MNKQLALELKVGLFVSAGIALIMLAILFLGGGTSVFSRPLKFHTHFPQADGLFQGAKVVIGGLSVGSVSNVDLDPKTQDIQVEMQIERKYESFIREGSEAEINTQGVLGDKYLSISLGPQDKPPLPGGSALPARVSQDIKQIFSRSEQLMQNLGALTGSLDRLVRAFESENSRGQIFRNLSETSKNLAGATQKLGNELDDLQLKRATRNLNQILEKVNNGNGTLGALVNDPSLYDDIKALTGGANRNRIVRNLVRQTIRDSEKSEAKGAAPKK